MDRRVLILYGTESGNSLEKAERVDAVCQRLRVATDLAALDAVRLNDLVAGGGYGLVVFVVATTGQGAFPANARRFWTSLRRAKLPPGCLAAVRYALFGLGDSAYARFNWAARLLHSRLQRLGAAEAYAGARAEGDERHDAGTDSLFAPWLDGLAAFVGAAYPLPAGVAPVPEDAALPLRYTLAVEEGAPGEGDVSADAGSDTFLPIPDAVDATVVANTRVTPPDHWQDVRLLQLAVPADASHRASVGPGDAVALFAENDPADVAWLLDRMGWTAVADRPVRLPPPGPVGRGRPEGLFARPGGTLRQLLARNLDIAAVPSRTALARLAPYTDHAAQRARLFELAQPANAQDFYDFATRPRRTLLEVLAEFHACHLPVEAVPTVFPVLRPRLYSIASGGGGNGSTATGAENGGAGTATGAENGGAGTATGAENGGAGTATGAENETKTLDLLIALVHYQTIIRKPRQGLCSRHIRDRCAPGTRLRIQLRRSDRPPPGARPDADRPLLAVAAGTGIAPVRSLLQDRAASGEHPGQTLLFFGCRNAAADYFFADEWQHHHHHPHLTVVPAFSRDHPPADADANAGPGAKDYVQHAIRRHAAAVCDLLRACAPSAAIVVCGSAGRMPVAVRAALRDAAVLGGLCATADEAEQRLFGGTGPDRIEYWEETW